MYKKELVLQYAIIFAPEHCLQEVQSVPALYGSAKAYAILKQTHKAKAQLKKVLDRNWTIAEADVLEKCWL